jgi:predicted lipoprotein with Yx(FWY)xxD motif
LSLKLGIILLTAVLAVAAATAVAESADKYTIDVQPGPEGNYLVNETGFSLYYFVNDAPGNGTSTCSGDCSKAWPPFYVESIEVPEGLSSSDFTIVSRADGDMQVTFKGWPLYLFSEDKAPGDINGQGKNNLWYVVNPDNFPPVST